MQESHSAQGRWLGETQTEGSTWGWHTRIGRLDIIVLDEVNHVYYDDMENSAI